MASIRLKILKLFGITVSSIALQANTLQIISLSLQDEMSKIRQVVTKFDTSVVSFGDPKAPAPITLNCSDAEVTRGSGRWISDREFAFEFENNLPPGVGCAI